MAARRSALDNAAKNSPLQRLARTAGVKRISGMLYEELRAILGVHLEGLVSAAVVAMKLDKRKSIQLKDVILALEGNGLAYGGASSKRCEVRKTKRETAKVRYSRPGTEALREIKYYQKNSDCLVLPKGPFKRLIKETTYGYVEDTPNVGKAASLALQTACEDYLKELLYDALQSALSCKRVTVSPKDIQLVRRVRKEML